MHSTALVSMQNLFNPLKTDPERCFAESPVADRRVRTLHVVIMHVIRIEAGCKSVIQHEAEWQERMHCPETRSLARFIFYQVTRAAEHVFVTYLVEGTILGLYAFRDHFRTIKLRHMVDYVPELGVCFNVVNLLIRVAECGSQELLLLHR